MKFRDIKVGDKFKTFEYRGWLLKINRFIRDGHSNSEDAAYWSCIELECSDKEQYYWIPQNENIKEVIPFG